MLSAYAKPLVAPDGVRLPELRSDDQLTWAAFKRTAESLNPNGIISYYRRNVTDYPTPPAI